MSASRRFPSFGLHKSRPRGPRATARLRFLAASAIVLVSCATDRTAADRTPIAIGVGAIPGTPGYSSIIRGVELAIEQLRTEGASYRLRAPTAGGTSAVHVAQQLRDDPNVLAVVGHPESGNTLEAVPIYADAERNGERAVVVISPTATSPRLTGISPWFFRVAPSDAVVARFAANWVRDSLSARRAAIIYRNDSYGRDWTETFAKVFTSPSTTTAATGGVIVAREPYLTGVVEWEAYATHLAALRPDVVLFPGDADDALALIRALHALGVNVPFIGGDGTEAMKRDADALGAHYVTFFNARQAQGPEATRFLARYRDRFHNEPDYFAAQAYDATLVIGRTAARGARSRAALRLALERVGRAAPAIDGVSGPIGFGPTHDLQQRRLFVNRVDSLTVGGRR